MFRWKPLATHLSAGGGTEGRRVCHTFGFMPRMRLTVKRTHKFRFTIDDNDVGSDILRLSCVRMKTTTGTKGRRQTSARTVYDWISLMAFPRSDGQAFSSIEQPFQAISVGCPIEASSKTMSFNKGTQSIWCRQCTANAGDIHDLSTRRFVSARFSLTESLCSVFYEVQYFLHPVGFRCRIILLQKYMVI
jgi:hypothetical protein